MKNVISTAPAPTAYVTKRKQRIKQNFDTVYLNNGDEFEIELYNPTDSKVLAQIELNGKSIGAIGIVLRPGERVFLERFLNESKKFIFETYFVGNSDDTKKAIQKNGTVTVKFYNEKKEQAWYTGNFGLTINPLSYVFPSIDPNQFYYGTTAGQFNSDASNATLTQSSGSATYTSSVSVDLPKNKLSKSIETGRIEKGSESNQSFDYDNSVFNTYYSWQTTWKILPFSQKHVDPTELRVYCTSCGSKRKKQSHMFCPNCGTKY